MQLHPFLFCHTGTWLETTVQFEESLGIKVFRVQAISFLPDLPQLILAALQNATRKRWEDKTAQTLSSFAIAKLMTSASTGHTYWVVDLRVVGMLLFHLLIVLLLFFSLILIQRFQVFLSVMLLHHFISFEFVMSLFVIVLQIFGGLDGKRKRKSKSAHSTLVFLKSKFRVLDSMNHNSMLSQRLLKDLTLHSSPLSRWNNNKKKIQKDFFYRFDE